MMAEIDPMPDQITIVVGSTQMNILPFTIQDNVKVTQLQHLRHAGGRPKHGG